MSRGPGRPSTDPAARFWTKVQKTDACWTWTDALNKDGYGRLKVDGRHILAHRFSWELAGNDLPAGMQVDHRCHNRACVNPAHLRCVSQCENMQNLAGPQSRNVAGARGVTWDPRKRRYRVSVRRGGKSNYGGQFATLEEAAEAARQLRLSLFTHNDLDRRTA